MNDPSLPMTPWVNNISRSALLLEEMPGGQVCCTCFGPPSFVSDPMSPYASDTFSPESQFLDANPEGKSSS